jgi:riboflavin transporter
VGIFLFYPPPLKLRRGEEGVFMKKFTTREIAISASLAAISAVTQLVHLVYQSPQWGMWIDVVAVTWIVAYFLFGLRASILVSLLGALVITLFAPDTWLGAGMKWVATMPMWASLALWVSLRKKSPSQYSKITRLIIPIIIGIIIRCLLVIPLNYYYAIPIWTGMTPVKAMATIPWYIIAGFNAVQGILDVVLAWIIVYRFRLNRYATHSK